MNGIGGIVPFRMIRATRLAELERKARQMEICQHKNGELRQLLSEEHELYKRKQQEILALRAVLAETRAVTVLAGDEMVWAEQPLF